MARKAFTPDQVAALNANPNVRLATDRSIQFAEQFKTDAIDAYLKGKPRVRIFADAGIAQSMSRRGNCWDNAPMESFFGHAKDELSLRRCSDFGDVLEEMASYIDYYNNDRPQMGLGRMTPAEFRDYLLARPVRLPALINEKDCCRPAAIL